MTTAIAPREDRALYHIVDDLIAYRETLEMLKAQLADGLPDEEREQTETALAEVEERIYAIGQELAGKTDDVAFVLRRHDLEEEDVHRERARLKAKELAIQKSKDWLRRYVADVMIRNGIRQLKTPLNTLFLRSSDAVVILDAEKLPAEYQNAEVKLPLNLWHAMRGAVRAIGPPELLQQVDAVRVKTEPVLTPIKKQIKAGEDVPGVDLAMNESLVVR